MRNIVYGKVKRLRENLHLRETYMADLLKMQLSDYLMFESGYYNLEKDQIALLARALGVSEQYLYIDEVSDNKVLARTDDEEITDNDKRQIAEFKNFQRKLGKKRDKELVFN
ncbi:helix-turn-helix transcriptional regulator [Bacillus inaquosorum]|uniref:helix-turn-helix domain-containing protein n=1 Tax=Bacillus subtilis group TaxID=653685 RepID=UPI00228118BF|nr:MULTISPECIES: helix-turn-helix transcriptional regulator [Bacillus subtilis group]MCY8387855.1 helix-turn-helix transcriptional regulator [Bacillus inaquosorum]MEC1663024.1 helix-turn-helix transcriptional regulator [Bacillus halotolerans]